MLYHNHVWRREMTDGPPDPDDPDDDVLLVETIDGDARGLVGYSREEWCALFRELRRAWNVGPVG